MKEGSGSMPSINCWIFKLIWMQFGGFLGHLHYMFSLMGCQRGVTRHPDNPLLTPMPVQRVGAMNMSLPFRCEWVITIIMLK